MLMDQLLMNKTGFVEMGWSKKWKVGKSRLRLICLQLLVSRPEHRILGEEKRVEREGKEV